MSNDVMNIPTSVRCEFVTKKYIYIINVMNVPKMDICTLVEGSNTFAMPTPA